MFLFIEIKFTYHKIHSFKNHTIQWVLMYSRGFVTITTTLIPEYPEHPEHQSKEETLYPLEVTFFHPCPQQPLAIINLYSVCMHFSDVVFSYNSMFD